MKDEELKGVNETQPTDSDEETLDFDIFGDLEDEYGEEKEKEPEEKPDKTAEWDREEAIKAYKNAEKKLGDMGRELGELRKKVESIAEQPATTTKAYTIDDIPAMDDLTLDTFLNTYKLQLSDPDVMVNDIEKYNRLMLEFQALNTEKAARIAKERLAKEEETKNLTNLQAKVKNEFNLSDNEAKELINLAKRLDSKPGARDLEAAFLKLFPDKFYERTATRNKSKLEQAKTTPRLPETKSSPTNKVVTAEQYRRMSEEEREQYVNNASLEELDALWREIKK